VYVSRYFGWTTGYQNFIWFYNNTNTGEFLSEGALFFTRAAAGPCAYTVTTIGQQIQIEYNTNWFKDENSRMFIQSTWGSHIFYINWG